MQRSNNSCVSEETQCCVQQLVGERVVKNMVHCMYSIKNAKQEVYLSQRVNFFVRVQGAILNLSAGGNININLSSILASESFSLSVSVQCMNIKIEVIMPPNILALLPGSDGKLYSLPFHPQPSPELPGSFVNTVRAVSTKHPVALLALSSSHVAVYGADPSEEGELLLHQ